MTRLILVLLLLLLIPSPLLAQGTEGVLAPAANPLNRVLYDYRNTIRLQDDCISGTATTGIICQLGWTVGGGTNSYLALAANRYGLLQRDTSALINTIAYTILGSSTNSLDPALPHKLTYITKLNQVDVNTTVWAGAANSSIVSIPADGIYIEKRDADTNWFCVTRAAASQTRTDSGVAITTNYVKFELERTSANVRFMIDGALVCTHTATITTTALNPGLLIVTSAAASKTIVMDYFELMINGISR